MPKNTAQAASFLRRGVQELKAERYGIALGLLEKALKLDKDNPEILCRLAQLHIVTWKSEEAIEYAAAHGILVSEYHRLVHNEVCNTVHVKQLY